MSSHRKGLLYVGLGVVVFSPDALIVRSLRLPVPSIVFWRGVLLCAGFLALASIRYRGAVRVRFARAGRLDLAVACLNALSNILFVTSITHTAVSNTLVILAAAPVFGAILSAVFLGERIRRTTWAASAIVLAGVAAIVHANLSGPNLTGDLAAVAASITASGMYVVLRAKEGSDPVPGITMGGLLAALVALPVAAGSLEPAPRQIALLVALGAMLPTALALVTRGPRYLPAPEIGLVMLVEAVLGPLWVWLALGQVPGGATLASGGLILAVLVVHSVLALREEAAAAGPAAADQAA